MAASAGWDASDIGDLTGRVALVTGANSGVGYATAAALADHGAYVLLGCRDMHKGSQAVADLESDHPHAEVGLLELDLADLDSVREAARSFRLANARLDLLVNNAGVMGSVFARTVDGLERQFATNHFGHFALTGLLLERLLTTEGSRVVTVSSGVHRMGHLDEKEWRGEREANRWRTYANTKLANLLFAYELDRRLRACGARTISVAAHPGYARTNLPVNGPLEGGSRWRARAARVAAGLGQSPDHGALPSLYAATAPSVTGGEYFGPGNPGELFGPPVRVRSNRASHDLAKARALWESSEELTGVTYRFGAGTLTPPPGGAAGTSPSPG